MTDNEYAGERVITGVLNALDVPKERRIEFYDAMCEDLDARASRFDFNDENEAERTRYEVALGLRDRWMKRYSGNTGNVVSLDVYRKRDL